MADIKFTLNSKNFEATAHHVFKQLWNEQDFADVTLATVDNQQIRAHKVILSSCSPFFRNILLTNTHQNPLLYLKDIKHNELEMIMQFIYLGQCEVGKDDLESFLATGQDLEVNGLTEEVNINNVINPEIVNTYEQNTLQFKEQFAPIDADSYAISQKPVSDGKYGHECVQCDGAFATTRDLARHRESKHVGIRYDCDQCNGRFTRQSSLIKHKQYKHEGVRYYCDQCDGRFTTQDFIIKHKQAQHEGVRHQCDQCHERFSTQNYLMIHKKSKHEGVSYDCDQCSGSFSIKSSLVTHKKNKH